jgi:hypothetical protein
MQKNKKFFLFTSIMVLALLIAGLSARISNGEASYEVEHEIKLPEYKSDTARMIDSYERTVNRLMDMKNNNSALVNIKLQNIENKLDKLIRISEENSNRLQKIEEKLGIEPEKKAECTKTKKQIQTQE